jgi:hypothetical protein
LVCSASASAQTSLSGPATSVLFDTGHLDDAFTIALDPDTTKHIHPTYWKEGALIGGIVGAIPGALLGHDLCETDDNPNNNCFVGTLLGAFGGANSPGFSRSPDRRRVSEARDRGYDGGAVRR